MIELRPALLPREAPLRLGCQPRARRDVPVGPLFRSAVLAAILAGAVGLPLLHRRAVAVTPGLSLAPLQAAGRAAPNTIGMRVALIREASR